MKKGPTILIVVIVVAILAIGGYAIFHKSNKTNNGSSNAPAVNNAVVITKSSSSLGQYLAEPNGTPLYTYNADSSGASNCTGACLATWPAYQDKGSTSNLPSGIATITRKDNGQIQYTYNGMPLYAFVSDSSGGQPTGNGVQNFSLAKPAASASTSSQSNTTSTSTQSSTSSGGGYSY